MKPRLHPIAMTASLLAVMGWMDVSPVAAQRMSVADRVAILEQRSADASAAASNTNIEFLNQINELRKEFRELRGQVETLAQQNEQLNRSLRSQVLDLDERLQALERAAQPPSAEAEAEAEAEGGSAAPPVLQGHEVAAARVVGVDLPVGTDDAADPAPDPAEERAQYESAFDALKSGRYPEAARLFQAFLRAFPEGALTANARYWLGESYYVVEDYANAQRQFEALIARFPDHDKTPGALLKLGLSQYGQKQYEAAEATLNEVSRRYPGTDAARIAADRLRAIQLSRLN